MRLEEAILSPQGENSTVNSDNPWPGLLPFAEADKGYFRGRQGETEDLLRLVLRERLAVLFGLSGLGKSSLLQAGCFTQHLGRNVFPVSIPCRCLPPRPTSPRARTSATRPA